MKHGFSDHDSSTGSDVETLACLTPTALCCYNKLHNRQTYYFPLKMLQRHQHHKQVKRSVKELKFLALASFSKHLRGYKS